MARIEVFQFLFALFFSSAYLQVESVENSKHLESPFRLAKHNLLWDRAKKSFRESPKLDSLYKELKKLDKLSLTLKHIDDKESEDAKLLAVDAREMYLDILNRYGLSTNKVGTDDHHQHTKAKFSDKIETLWQEAVYSGKFTQDELESLEKEFKHHERKIEDYRQLADKIVDHDSISDNDIRSLDRLPESEIKKLKKDLKNKHHNMSVQFLDLKKKVKERVSKVEGDFTDSRVVEIWEAAQNRGFSKEELESIKEELKHFQIRIDKHNYWKTRQDKLGQELNEGHITEPMEHEQIVDKVKEHGRVVKKYHATMLDRVERKDEL